MDASESMLKTVVGRLRNYLDDPDIDGKYSDSRIVSDALMPSFASVVSRINNSGVSQTVGTLSISIDPEVQRYLLPPSVGEIERIAVFDDQRRIVREAIPRGSRDAWGPNWSVQGNMIVFQPVPSSAEAAEVVYIHSGWWRPAYFAASSSHQLSADGDGNLTRLSVDASVLPLLGSLDRRPGAYAGCFLRLLPSSSTGVVEERVVDSWEPVSPGSSSVWTATVHLPFDHAAAGNAPAFELGFEPLEPLYEACACHAALKVASWRRFPSELVAQIQMQYRDSMKTCMDHFSNVQARMPKVFDRRTVDNQLGQPWRM